MLVMPAADSSIECILECEYLCSWLQVGHRNQEGCGRMGSGAALPGPSVAKRFPDCHQGSRGELLRLWKSCAAQSMNYIMAKFVDPASIMHFELHLWRNAGIQA